MLRAIGKVSQWLEHEATATTTRLVVASALHMQVTVGELQHELQTAFKKDQIEMQRDPGKTQKEIENISIEVYISIQQLNSADMVLTRRC